METFGTPGKKIYLFSSHEGYDHVQQSFWSPSPKDTSDDTKDKNADSVREVIEKLQIAKRTDAMPPRHGENAIWTTGTRGTKSFQGPRGASLEAFGAGLLQD